MSKRRRYHTMATCEACGRTVSDEQLSAHERACPAWRKRLADAREDGQAAVLPPQEAPSDLEDED